MQQLDAQEASFVYGETPHTPMHIGTVGIYDPSTAAGRSVRFTDALTFIEQRLARARSFRQRMVRVPFDLDHPYWIEDPDFDLRYHVRHTALPKPGDWRQLCIQVARLHAQPMDLAKPLWEFTVVEGLDNVAGLPAGCFALVSKVHQAASDGTSAVELSAAVHDADASMKEASAPDGWAPENMPAVADLLARSYLNSWVQTMRVMGTVGRCLPGMARLSRHLSEGDVPIGNAQTAPATRLNGKVSAHRVWDAIPFRLSEARAIADAVPGATVDEVILSIVGGALRTWLTQCGELPEETLTAMTRVAGRASDEREALGSLGSAIVVGLGSHLEDPLARLRFVHEEAVNSRALTNATGANSWADHSQLISSGLAGLVARLHTRIGAAEAHAPPYNCVVTNVPGSRVPLYFCGARLIARYGMGALFDGMGLINTICGYGPVIAISFTCCREMMPDPDRYAAALRSAFAVLRTAAAQVTGFPTAGSHPVNPAQMPAAAGRKPATRKGA